MATLFPNVRGTRDILGLEHKKKLHLLNLIRLHLSQYSFDEIEVPILGDVRLFAKTLGEQVDAVEKELFLVRSRHQDQGDGYIALRPEATASVFRAYCESLPSRVPWRVFTCGPMFRYERPQRGRFREFWQCSIEMINAKSIFYDVEIILMLHDLFTKLGIKNHQIDINFLGESHERSVYLRELENFFHREKSRLSPKIIEAFAKNPLRAFDKKTESDEEILFSAPRLHSYFEKESSEKWEKIKDLLEKNNLNYNENLLLVRGLDYYSGIVFEFSFGSNVFCGGGRYDGLGSIFGSNSEIPSIGAGIGIDRVCMLLAEEYNESFFDEKVVGIAVQKNMFDEYAFSFSRALHEKGCKNEVFFDKDSLRSALRKGESDKVFLMTIIGEMEQNTRTITIKRFDTGEQMLLPFEDAIAKCKQLICNVY